MAKSKKQKRYKYVAIPKNSWEFEPWVFKDEEELVKEINNHELSINDFHFFKIGESVKVQIIIQEPVFKAKKAKINKK